MTELQARLLLETEFKFYQLQVGPDEFGEILHSLGFKANPDLTKISSARLKRLNMDIRKSLRS